MLRLGRGSTRILIDSDMEKLAAGRLGHGCLGPQTEPSPWHFLCAALELRLHFGVDRRLPVNNGHIGQNGQTRSYSAQQRCPESEGKESLRSLRVSITRWARASPLLGSTALLPWPPPGNRLQPTAVWYCYTRLARNQKPAVADCRVALLYSGPPTGSQQSPTADCWVYCYTMRAANRKALAG